MGSEPQTRERSQPKRKAPRNVGFRLLVAGWCLLLSLPVLWVAYNEFMGVTACEHPRFDSNYGELSWSVLPPGRVCRFANLPDGRPVETSGPHLYMSLYLLVTLLAGVALLRRRPRT